MIKKNIKGISYKLPGSLTIFQEDMYIHLINWKWNNITKEPGIYEYKKQKIEYDAILPESKWQDFPIIYPNVLSKVLLHKKKYNFKNNIHINHMASSQIANINLFLPILLSSNVNSIIKNIDTNNDLSLNFNRLAVHELYKGFRIEYWDGNSELQSGLLGDHSARSGTDSDIAIAFYNNENELCLWLVEHKLTEREFTQCGGAKSENNINKINCNKSFSDVIKNKDLCYYHNVRRCKYWDITSANASFFVNHTSCSGCPFKGGMNQLWRNQMLGLALENAGTYKHVYFSVVHHPRNTALNKSISNYKTLINNNKKFSVLTSADIINASDTCNDLVIQKWIKWYKDLYKI
ncbi:MAG TPA: hypothetical protein VFF33_13450 [Ignavibacteriaceae bacterium]|nr:hypothetical protein [Ignavibacteriaceae bacterium]